MKSIFTLILTIVFSHFTAHAFSQSPSPDFAQLRSNLYIVSPDKSTVLMDGTLTQWDHDFTNELSGLDARKMGNPGENWGMLRDPTVLIIERRHTIDKSDSIFFKMWNMRIITYRLEFISANLNRPGRVGILEDNYLKTATPIDLNGTTFIDFSVTADPASKATDRFRLIFNTAAYSPMPLNFTSVKAVQQNNAVQIDWTTANENNVKKFDIERSTNGTHFVKIADARANNAMENKYHITDANPVNGNNYYRIRSEDMDGKSQFSTVMKVYIGKGPQSIGVYPNPAIGGNLNLQLVNQAAGLYEVRLLNAFGQRFLSQSLSFAGGNGTQNLKLGQNIPKGIYWLEIKAPSGERTVISVGF